MNLSPQEAAEGMIREDGLPKAIELATGYAERSPSNKQFWKMVLDILIKKVKI